MWSPILFGEKISEILQGLEVPQYSDDILVGAETLEELYKIALKVFGRFEECGVRVNFDKVVWISTKIKFLGYEIENGKMSLKDYIQKKKETLGEIRTIKDLEGLLASYLMPEKPLKGQKKYCLN